MKSAKDVKIRAQKFYANNLTSWLAGEFTALSINLQPPSGKIATADDGAAVKAWMNEWSKAPYPVEYSEKKLSYLGTYSLPHRVHLDSPARAAEVAGCLDAWTRTTSLLDHLCTELQPDISSRSKVRDSLISFVRTWQQWDDAQVAKFIKVVTWLRSHDASKYFIRELPIKGVDTKWLERNGKIVKAVVGPIHFRAKPTMIELRSLDRNITIFGHEHIACPIDALAEHRPGGAAVKQFLIVENHMTFLALPPIAGTVAINGAGFKAQRLATAPWLLDTPVAYWGDLDSHGFAILDHTRAHLPHLQSVLMDIDTAKSHIEFAVEESNPSREDLVHLTPSEIQALNFLRDRSLQGCLRIEQERIVFDHVEAQLRAVLES